MAHAVNELQPAVAADHADGPGLDCLELFYLHLKNGIAVGIGFFDGDDTASAAAAQSLFFVGRHFPEALGSQHSEQLPRLLDYATAALNFAGVVEGDGLPVEGSFFEPYPAGFPEMVDVLADVDDFHSLRNFHHVGCGPAEGIVGVPALADDEALYTQLLGRLENPVHEKLGQLFVGFKVAEVNHFPAG